MRAGRGVAAWIVGWALAASAAAAPPMSIKFAEPVAIPATAGKAEFDAYGRRFPLTLESNDRLVKSMARKAGRTLPRVLRGRITGVAGSWVRLTRVGNGMQGAIWDGNDIYVIARYGSIARHLTTPLDASPDQTVVYRLSDTLNGLPPEFCGLSDEPAASANASASAGASTKPATTGLQQYKNLVAELRASAQTAGDLDTLSISLIADQAYQAQFGANSEDSMIARLNVVDGIFTEQVGVILTPSETRLVPANADPFTSTQADVLLDQLSTYRQNNPAVRAAGLAHLMTGKNLNDDVLGIAFLDVLCDVGAGVSLSDSETGEFFSALVMAHEIGHNFGAEHDGVPGACSSTPTTFLMSPQLNGSSQFSQCSLDSMALTVAAARGSCLAPASYADLALLLPPSPYLPVSGGTGFAVPFTIRSQGNLAATNVGLVFSFPPGFTPQAATIAGATCTFSPPLLSCALGDFALAEERALTLEVTGLPPGGFSLEASVAADNDAISFNNSSSVLIVVQSGIDLAVSLAADPTTVYVGDPVDFTVDVVSTSHSTLPSHGGRVRVNIDGIPIESFDAGPHSCQIDQFTPGLLYCDLADIAAGASTRITLRGRPTQARQTGPSVDLMNLASDSDPTNNYSTLEVSVISERSVRLAASTEDLRAVLDTTYEITYTLTTGGRLPAQNVRFSLQAPPEGVVESVTSEGITCAPAGGFTNCEFGALNPGDVRTVVVRFHMEVNSASLLSASVRWDSGAGFEYSNVFTNVYASFETDVAASASYFFGVDEGVTGIAGMIVETRGILPAQNVTGTIEVPAPMRLLALEASLPTTGWTCELLTPQRGRCTGSFTPDANQYVNPFAVLAYSFTSDVAGDYQATVTVDASGDGDPTNNVAQVSLPITPYLDVAIDGPRQERIVLVGQTTTVDATIITGKNPVPAVGITPWAGGGAAVTIDSFEVTGFDCSQSVTGVSCNLGDLPPNATIPVRAVFRAASPSPLTYVQIMMSAQRDSNPINNTLPVPIVSLGQSNISLSVAQSSLTGKPGTMFTLPRITVTNGTQYARDVTVDIPLPPFATLLFVQSNGFICSGTASLQCTMPSMFPGDSREIDIDMNPVTSGSFTSHIVLSALNDSTPDNNAASIAVNVSAPPPPSSGGSSSSGGGKKKGGGGGRFEWLALAFLGMMVVKKWGHSPFPSKWGQSPFSGKRGRS